MSAIAKILPLLIISALLVTVAPLAIIIAYSSFAENITPDASVEGEWNMFMDIGKLVTILVTDFGWVAAIGLGLTAIVTVLIGVPAALFVLAKKVRS